MYDSVDDRISKLPDEILVYILSFLTTSEAARTSVLSSRWKNLWKQISSLDFGEKLATMKWDEFVQWVNCALESRERCCDITTLKEFRICFDINRGLNMKCIDMKFELELALRKLGQPVSQWLEYACSRQVERLYLDFSASDYKNLMFPSLNFPLFENFANLRHGDFSLKSLTSLSLKCVAVNDEDIKFILLSCPLLEQLIVHDSNELLDLEVCGSSLVLKHLEIFFCSNLIRVKVSAPYLTSLTIMRLKELILENVPMLAVVSISCGGIDISFGDLVNGLSCCISQLENLTLLVNPKGGIESFPQILKLKKLVIEYVSMNDESRKLLTSLLIASPYLHELVLKIHSHCSSSSGREVESDMMRFSQQRIKVFKMCGYSGQSRDVKLVRYILDNCILLEKVIVDRRRYFPRFPDGPSTPYIVMEQIAKEQLEPHMPQHIDLVIL